MSDRPLILVSNDDGIRAKGIVLLAEALKAVGDVYVIAPADQQSAVGHGITLGKPLRVRQVDEQQFAVTGRPADAVFLGIGEICPRQPDLVVSGINHGPNLGVDVLYSGTVAAAMEGATRDIPAIAVSQMLPPVQVGDPGEGHQVSPWHAPDEAPELLSRCLERTAAFAAQAALALLANPLPAGVVLNINGPVAATEEYRWARLGRQFYRPSAVRRLDPRGIPYYWIAGELTKREAVPGTDISTVLNGAFSLTALTLDWTAASGALELPGYKPC